MIARVHTREGEGPKESRRTPTCHGCASGDQGKAGGPISTDSLGGLTIISTRYISDCPLKQAST